MERLMVYAADKGSIVLNGVCISNGYGDGEFQIYFSNEVPEGYEKIENVWFDLRECDLKIWRHDCNKGQDFERFSREYLGCDAIEVYRRSGRIYLVKYF